MQVGNRVGKGAARSARSLPFARKCATVLDCANGYQKENQEEVNEIKEGRRSEEETGKEASAETDSP